jgi:soluble lytic murein transglycosylase-like protein
VKIGFIRSIIAAESTFHRNAVSAKGAIGLMQVMPETAHEMGDDPKVPEQNIDAGARYLKSLLYRYRNCRDQVKRAIAAYNAGPGNVDKYNGIPPFPETQSYVRRVMAFYERF